MADAYPTPVRAVRLSLVRRMLPAIPWLPWLPITILIGVLVLLTVDLPDDFGSRHVYVRAGFLIDALGLSFTFDDAAAPTTDAAPSPLWLRRSVRVVLSMSLWGFLVLGLLWVAGIDPSDPAPIRGRFLLEASAVGAWGLAIASVIAKRWDEEPGRIASAALLTIYAISWMVPERWKPWAAPTDSRWDTGYAWWWIAFGLAVLITVVSSWDSRPWNPASAQKTRDTFVVGNSGSAA